MCQLLPPDCFWNGKPFFPGYQQKRVPDPNGTWLEQFSVHYFEVICNFWNLSILVDWYFKKVLKWSCAISYSAALMIGHRRFHIALESNGYWSKAIPCSLVATCGGVARELPNPAGKDSLLLPPNSSGEGKERLWRWREGWAWGSLSVEVKDSNGGWGLFDVSAASSSDFWNRYAFAMGVLSHVASSVVYVGGGLECISAWTGKGWGAGWKIATLAPFWELFQFAFS